jgi:hypothetical protein
MTDKINPDLSENNGPAEIEDADDDRDYTPRSIKRLLDNPPLLPGEDPNEFVQLFEEFEYRDSGFAKTATEYILVYTVTMLTWELMRYQRLKVALLLNQQRAAVESLFRKTHDAAMVKGTGPALTIEANQSARAWFADPAYRAQAAKKFEAAGYAAGAAEAEAFERSLGALARIENLVASAQKRVMSFLKDLESRFGSRAAEMRMVATKAVGRVSGEDKALE